MKHHFSSSLLIAILFASAQVVADDSIQQIYDNKCSVCHVSGVAGAPKLDDQEAWAPRLEKGATGLIASVTNGLGGMPPMGTCSDCSQEDIAALIELMTAGVQ